VTTAICFKCGTKKFGAFNPCRACKAQPRSDDELVLSLAMTDHSFPEQTLDAMGARIASGLPVNLNPETRAGMLEALGKWKKMKPRIAEMMKAEQTAKPGSPESKSSRWWKFWDRPTS
jgi:hypothetical protein